MEMLVLVHQSIGKI